MSCTYVLNCNRGNNKPFYDDDDDDDRRLHFTREQARGQDFANGRHPWVLSPIPAPRNFLSLVA